MSINDTINQNVGQVVNFQDYINDQVNTYIVKPFTANGIGGFVFSTRDEDTLELKAEITDYQIENNTSVQDHIAIKPMVITLRGFVGELANIVNQSTMGALGTLQQKLTSLNTYLPSLTTRMTNDLNNAIANSNQVVQKINSAVDRAQNLVGLIANTTYSGTAQEQALLKLKSLFNTKQIITVETPWGYFDNMAISNITVQQDGKTSLISDIAITLKQLQFVATTTGTLSQNQQGRYVWQASPVVNKGQTQGTLIQSVETADWKGIVGGSMKNAMSYILEGA